MPEQRWIANEVDRGIRLDKWLALEARCGSRARALDALASGKVFVNGREAHAADAGRRLEAGDTIALWMDRPGSATRRGPRRMGPLDIVFEDDLLIVLNKPAGLLTVPLPSQPQEPSLADLVGAHWRSHGRAPLVVHRIDRETSGLVVFARTNEAWRALKTQFAARLPTRRYLALVEGSPSPVQGEWRDHLRWDPRRLRQLPATGRGRDVHEAITRYRTLESFDGTAFLELTIVTGRQHQIRFQAWRHGHTLLGERVYRDGEATVAARRQMLHAAHLAFAHPRTDRRLALDAPPPSDFRAALAAERRRGAAKRSSLERRPRSAD